MVDPDKTLPHSLALSPPAASLSTLSLKRKKNTTQKCCPAFSAGTFEESRSDSEDFDSSWLGEEREEGASGERWLNITAEVRGRLRDRLGCSEYCFIFACDGGEQFVYVLFLRVRLLCMLSSRVLVREQFLGAFCI